MPVNVFISHKARDAKLARSIVKLLKAETENTNFYLSEDIRKGADWRKDIDKALRACSSLILLYTDPALDWSWCLYEAGIFDGVRGVDDAESDEPKRWLYCIHFPGIPAPDALGGVQTITATGEDFRQWLADFYADTGQRTAFRGLDNTATQLQLLMEKSAPVGIKTTRLRPSIDLYPKWKGEGAPDWRIGFVPADLPLEQSTVMVDDISARVLQFSETPQRMNVIQFLKRLDTEGSGAKRMWTSRLLKSVQAALDGRMSDQEVTYFRFVKGNILRPIVDSVTRAEDGSSCHCRIVFVDAFSPPPSVTPSPLQLVANGLRLATRTRLEILNKFAGKMLQERTRLERSTDPADELEKRLPLPGRVVEMLNTIVIEAEMQGARPDEAAPLLFQGEAQTAYEAIRSDFRRIFGAMKATAAAEDVDSVANCERFDSLLTELDKLNRNYVALAAPRFSELLRDL